MIDYAVILAGGCGSRFLPITKAIPKPMLPLVDRPAIEFVVEEVLLSRINNIAIVVGHQGDVIKNYFSKMKYIEKLQLSDEIKQKLEFCNKTNIHFFNQAILDGTASAVLSAKEFVGKNDFAILNADELFLVKQNQKPVTKQLIDLFKESNSCVVGTKKVTKKQATKLGIVEGRKIKNNVLKMKNILEKPPLSSIHLPIANVGRYVVKNEIFDFFYDLKPNRYGEKALTDVLVNYAQSKDVLCLQVQGKRYDLGDKQSFLQAYFDCAVNDEILGTEFRKFLKKHFNN